MLNIWITNPLMRQGYTTLKPAKHGIQLAPPLIHWPVVISVKKAQLSAYQQSIEQYLLKLRTQLSKILREWTKTHKKIHQWLGSQPFVWVLEQPESILPLHCLALYKVLERYPLHLRTTLVSISPTSRCEKHNHLSHSHARFNIRLIYSCKTCRKKPCVCSEVSLFFSRRERLWKNRFTLSHQTNKARQQLLWRSLYRPELIVVFSLTNQTWR